MGIKSEDMDSSLIDKLDSMILGAEKTSILNKDEQESSEKDLVSPFVFNDEVNKKIILWQGDLCSLQVDAIVNTTNERLADRSGISGRIFYLAGSELDSECIQLEGCPTGDAVIS